MYKNRLADGSCNICGRKVARLRSGLSPKVSQRALAERMQLEGVDLDKNAIQRIECGKRFVTDIELRALAAALGEGRLELVLLLGQRRLQGVDPSLRAVDGASCFADFPYEAVVARLEVAVGGQLHHVVVQPVLGSEPGA